MLQFEASDLVAFEAGDFIVPLLRLNDYGPPDTRIRVEGDVFTYERSFPLKGHGAILPRYLAEQAQNGKRVLLVERFNRYYAYVSALPTSAAA